MPPVDDEEIEDAIDDEPLDDEPEDDGSRYDTGEAPAKSSEERRDQKAFDEVQESIEEWKTAEAATTELRENMRDDALFESGGGYQWSPGDRTAREAEQRPCLEINRIPQFIRQVSNQNRMSRSAIIVNARGYGSTKNVANVLQSIVRSVETDSDADIAYDTATGHQLVSGLGFVRLASGFLADDAFEQSCQIRRIRNPLSVYWDPAAQDATFADARYMHIRVRVPKKEYERRWGHISTAASLWSMMDGRSTGFMDWLPEGFVVVAERYYVKHVPDVLLMLSNNAKLWRSDYDRYMQAWQEHSPMGEQQPMVVQSREVQRKEVRWMLHNAIDILEGNENRTEGRLVPGTRIPLYPVIGDERDIDGQIDYRGMVRDAKHPAQMYNFWSSSIAEAIALTPKTPWIAAKGQIENYMDSWKNANRQPTTVLIYDPVAVGDKPEPPPQRSSFSVDISAMVQGLHGSNQDLMSVMGLFEPSLGQRGSATESGKARLALQQQGDIANSNYSDNLQRTKRAIGRSIIEWAPVVYDIPRIMHLVQPDGNRKEAVVYAGAQNKPKDDEFDGIEGIYDIGVGTYDVSVSTGPSYQNEKQATEAWLLELFKVLPGMAAIGADIVLENSDHPAAKALARRAKVMLPPAVQDLDSGDPETENVELKGKLEQAQQILEKANQAISQMSKTIETKEVEGNIKREVAMIAANAQLAIAQSKIGSAQSLAAFQAESTRFAQLVDQIHADTVQDMQAKQGSEMSTQEHDQKVQQIGSQREAQGQLSAQDAQQAAAAQAAQAQAGGPPE